MRTFGEALQQTSCSEKGTLRTVENLTLLYAGKWYFQEREPFAASVEIRSINILGMQFSMG